jgi:uncharacterized membrane protein HdeD (DUF308 family)
VFVTNPFRQGTWTRQQLDQVSRGWWTFLVAGLISVVAGGIILSTDWTLDNLTFFIGALLVIRGLFMVISLPLDGSIRTTAVVAGLLEIGVGVAVFVWPSPTLRVLAAFIGWLLLFRGTLTIAGSIGARSFMPYWGLILAVGILEAVVAIWLLSQPGLTLVATVLAIGIAVAVYGVVLIAVSFQLKRLPSQAEAAVDRFNRSITKQPVGQAAS